MQHGAFIFLSRGAGNAPLSHCLCCSHAASYLTFYNLNQITDSLLAAPNHVTYMGLRSAAFWDWFWIFPWEQPAEPCACVCEFELTKRGGGGLPPLLLLSSLYYPPFTPLFPPPPILWNYHTLDSLCCHTERRFLKWQCRSLPKKEQTEGVQAMWNR